MVCRILFILPMALFFAWSAQAASGVPPNTYYFYHEYSRKVLSVFRLNAANSPPTHVATVIADSPVLRDIVTLEKAGGEPVFYVLQAYGELLRIDASGARKISGFSAIALAEHPDGLVAVDSNNDLIFVNGDGAITRKVKVGASLKGTGRDIVYKIKMLAPDTYIAVLSSNRVVIFEQKGNGEPVILRERTYNDPLFSPQNNKYVLDLMATSDVAWIGVREYQGVRAYERILRVDLKNMAAPVVFNYDYEPFLDIDPATGDLLKIIYGKDYDRMSLTAEGRLVHSVEARDVFAPSKIMGRPGKSNDRLFISQPYSPLWFGRSLKQQAAAGSAPGGDLAGFWAKAAQLSPKPRELLNVDEYVAWLRSQLPEIKGDWTLQDFANQACYIRAVSNRLVQLDARSLAVLGLRVDEKGLLSYEFQRREESFTVEKLRQTAEALSNHFLTFYVGGDCERILTGGKLP